MSGDYTSEISDCSCGGTKCLLPCNLVPMLTPLPLLQWDKMLVSMQCGTHTYVSAAASVEQYTYFQAVWYPLPFRK